MRLVVWMAQKLFLMEGGLIPILTFVYLLKDHGHDDYNTLCCLSIWPLCSKLAIQS